MKCELRIMNYELRVAKRSQNFLWRRLPVGGSRDRSLTRRGVLLLEVILALAILLMGMAVIGVQMNTSLETGYRDAQTNQALMLAEAKLAQLDSGVVKIGIEGLDGSFPVFPGYFYRFEIEPERDIDGMYRVKLEVLYDGSRIGVKPEDLVDAKPAEGNEVLMTLYTFRPTPPVVDLQRDFGLNDDQMADLGEKLPVELLDPTNISPSLFADLDPETLMSVLTAIGEAYGISEAQIQMAFQAGLLDPNFLLNMASQMNQGGGLPGGLPLNPGGESPSGDETKKTSPDEGKPTDQPVDEKAELEKGIKKLNDLKAKHSGGGK